MFIFLVLPTPVNVKFPYTLEHAVVRNLTGHNLGPVTGEQCRTLLWGVDGGLEIEQDLIVRRCMANAVSPPGTNAYFEGWESEDGTTQVLMAYWQPTGEVLLQLNPTTTTFGYLATYTTYVYRSQSSEFAANAVSSESVTTLRHRGDFDFAQLTPHFAEAVADTGCTLHSNEVLTCTGSSPDSPFGARTIWTLDCAGNATALSRAFTSMSLHAITKVDLRIAERQPDGGFAAGIEPRYMAEAAENFNPAFAQTLQSFLATLRGDGNVVARIKVSRINLASAVIMAAAAALIYQVMQIGDKSSTAIALHCLQSHHGVRHGESVSGSKGSGLGDSEGGKQGRDRYGSYRVDSSRMSGKQLEERAIAEARGSGVATGCTEQQQGEHLPFPPFMAAPKHGLAAV